MVELPNMPDSIAVGLALTSDGILHEWDSDAEVWTVSELPPAMAQQLQAMLTMFG